ncbi:sulfite exporter TauE/SafE family protein [Lacicoccus qingdaonensis]|uniref:Probable membrane transporter protein n=1 Tax=Lacicoccus qingdaonensis TaxID=576118 RepID=A0A1G9AX55_9BACL|nr:sulfite exporter TauE/SafE family protein [Salinicoccus qingdaonensis]SDK31906.1 hypothetical protein SAMN05216216_10229 [Salinicoccus qingdaonensis]
MQKLTIFALVGFFAQLIDGSLGMGFGATSSSLLLSAGIAPVIASATIHISQIATTAASGISHLKFGNVDKPLMLRLALPGALTSFLGAALLSSLDGDTIKPFISLFLLTMGFYVLYQFLFKREMKNGFQNKKVSGLLSIPLGGVAGFLDSIGGGGWGPVNTPVLLSRKKIEARKVVGTVSSSEFIVTISASAGFFIFLGFSQISWGLVIALALGGVIAAPFAAWLVKVIPLYFLAVFVGGLIIFTNSNILLDTFFQNSALPVFINSLVIVMWGGLLVYAYHKNKRNLALQTHQNEKINLQEMNEI